MAQKKTVFLTGASGNMGYQSFLEFFNHKDQFNIVVLLRDSEKNRKKFTEYINDPSVRIVWGDLKDYDAIKKGVDGSDYVLHIGGMVSPSADYYPTKTVVTNTTAARNIVDAVKAQPNPDAVKVVYIGTVAETGDRNAPIHWARCGDPIKISIYDHYACSKVIAEEIFAESGLKYWVSCRQSGILYADILKNMDPIMFHVPINGVLEWATVEDSARLMLNICGDDIPEEFWRRFYNIGSGEEYRLTNYEFEELLLDTIGIGSPKKMFQPNWFITRNFHGQWYYDGDELEKYCHFRANIPVKQY
ncbi:MAG: NAD(P)-dependent oxidoreductase, partial [Clostridia bacterium]|nr:NAD(P)-dependent oxidoreductase [Clostridia bacterium]